ncbi:MAG: hypothetical protein OIF40_05715 [Mangrovicoccus sp.]|nr:hypothetical protein [Mangrovicoccus sp.]
MRCAKAACLLAAALILSGCVQRPLSPNEITYAESLLPGLDPSQISVTRGAVTGNWIRHRPPRPAKACRERIFPPETEPRIPYSTAAFVLGEEIYYNRRLYRDDVLSAYPQTLALAHAMLLAHELTHVWQWQNRDMTGYHPLRALHEQRNADPYLYDLDPPQDFLDYGFEQQAALVEEYACCRALDPKGGRTQALYDLLLPYFPGLAPAEPAKQISLPWPDADTKGACA